MNSPLRYSISDWRQLSECRSNNSRELHLKTSDFVNDARLQGLRIEVVHDTFGVLFSYVVGLSGDMITDYTPEDELSTADLLSELAKFGYIIEYNPVSTLSGKQLDFLVTMSKLGYDKIRILNVQESATSYLNFVVLFNVKAHPDWINNVYCATLSEFRTGVINGTAFNVSSADQFNKFNWSWLAGYVASIDDILKDNTGTLEARYDV